MQSPFGLNSVGVVTCLLDRLVRIDVNHTYISVLVVIKKLIRFPEQSSYTFAVIHEADRTLQLVLNMGTRFGISCLCLNTDNPLSSPVNGNDHKISPSAFPPLNH